MCEALQASVVDLLSQLDARDFVQVEGSEDIVAPLDRFETPLKTAAIIIQPTEGVFNTVRFDVNKVLGQRSSLPNDIFGAGITPSDITPMQRRVLYTGDIKNISFENIEYIRQFIRRAGPTNPAPTTNVT